MEALQAREDLMKSIQNFLKKFNRISFRETPKVLIQAWDKFFKVKHAQPEDVQELLNKLLQYLQSINEELAGFINTPNWNRPAFYHDDDKDDDEEYTIAITPVLLTVEPDNSLSIGDEHLNTIPEKEKSSDENLVPIPSEFEDFSDIESECDVPDCDDSQTTNFSTFSNPFFDDSTFSDDETSHDEVIHEISFKTFSNPLFDIDEEIITSEFNPIQNEDLDSTLKNDHRNRFSIREGICIEVESTRFLATLSPVIDTLLPFSSENEDKVFNHCVLASKEKSPPSSSHRGFKASKLFHHKSPMLSHGENIPLLDVSFLHFYPP
ncbi:hypothetical protein Tco_1329489 [Tanacetum coccineum]